MSVPQKSAQGWQPSWFHKWWMRCSASWSRSCCQRSDDQNLLTRILTRQSKVNVSAAVTNSICQAASQLDTKLKDQIILSDMPFASSVSSESSTDSLTPTLLSDARTCDCKLAARIPMISDTRVTQAVLVSSLPFDLGCRHVQEALKGMAPHPS